IDFRTVLVWAITDSVGGQSVWPKPDSYNEILERAAKAPRLVRLSRLWHVVQSNPNLKEKDFWVIAQKFLEEQGVCSSKVQTLLGPLGELMTTFRDLKRSKVTYLQLLPYDHQLWNRDAYNDAIVSIFTRLNTAGRNLTREEITFSWLKVNWDATLTDGRSAKQCFDELRNELRLRGLDVVLDDIVNAASFIWSARFNDGKLLANSDLLKGALIRRIAIDLSHTWSAVRDSILGVTDVVAERDFVFGPSGQYASLNALAVLWTWSFLAKHWLTTQALTVVGKDDFEKKCYSTLIERIDRWILCSTWTGRWSTSSSTAVSTYAKDLADDWNEIAQANSHEAVHDILR